MIRTVLGTHQASVRDVQPLYEEARQGDIRRSLADIGKARALLGYEPTHDAKAGLDEVLHWYVEQLLSVDSPATVAHS